MSPEAKLRASRGEMPAERSIAAMAPEDAPDTERRRDRGSAVAFGPVAPAERALGRTVVVVVVVVVLTGTVTPSSIAASTPKYT